jgi:hypothetical protein
MRRVPSRPAPARERERKPAGQAPPCALRAVACAPRTTRCLTAGGAAARPRSPPCALRAVACAPRTTRCFKAGGAAARPRSPPMQGRPAVADHGPRRARAVAADAGSSHSDDRLCPDGDRGRCRCGDVPLPDGLAARCPDRKGVEEACTVAIGFPSRHRPRFSAITFPSRHRPRFSAITFPSRHQLPSPAGVA